MRRARTGAPPCRAGGGLRPVGRRVDLDAAEEAYLRAQDLATELDDTAMLAAASRELGVIDIGRGPRLLRRARRSRRARGRDGPCGRGRGARRGPAGAPGPPLAASAGERLHRALALYEELGDRQGIMASIIAMAYLSWGADIHMGSDSARHIEEIRRLATQLASFTSESQRAFAEVQMLYGVHVFARAKGIPTSRSLAARRRTRVRGRWATGSWSSSRPAVSGRDISSSGIGRARTWFDRAAEIASRARRRRGRQLELWRGLLHAAEGDVEETRKHLEHAVELAARQGMPAERCEARVARSPSRRSGPARRRGAARGGRTRRHRREGACRSCRGTPWGARADAALARVAPRGDADLAATHARAASPRSKRRATRT